jgi:hypothetical protein
MPNFEKWLSQATDRDKAFPGTGPDLKRIYGHIAFAIQEYYEMGQSSNPKGLVSDVEATLYDIDQMVDVNGDDIMPSFPRSKVMKELWDWHNAAYRNVLPENDLRLQKKAAGGKARAEIHIRRGNLFFFLSSHIEKAKPPINEYIQYHSVDQDYKALMKMVGKAKKALAGMKRVDLGKLLDVGPIGPTVQTSPNEVFTWLDLGDAAVLNPGNDGEVGQRTELIGLDAAIPDIIKALEGIGIPVQVK